MSDSREYSACIDAVKKTSRELVSLLSGGVVGLLEFGRELVDAEFTEQSGLDDALDPSLKNKEKIHKLSQMVTTQVQQDPKKYYKAYIAILEKFHSLSSLLQKIRTETGGNLSPTKNAEESAPTPEANTSTGFGGNSSPTKNAEKSALSPEASNSTELGESKVNAQKKGFTCPCGNCSLRHFLNGNCPEKGSGFPCLNKKSLSRTERNILFKRLRDKSNDIKIDFTRLLKSTELWLSNNSRHTPKQLKKILKHPNLSNASDFESIIYILDNSNVWSWFSFDYLERIIRICSPERNELLPEFNEYKREFNDYCKRSLFECPSLMASYEPKYHYPLFVKLADEEFKNPTLEDLRSDFEISLTTIIEVEPRDLVLLTYQEGCTQLIYSIPRDVANNTFPLSEAQKEMLLKMGVLECYLVRDDNPVESTTSIPLEETYQLHQKNRAEHQLSAEGRPLKKKRRANFEQDLKQGSMERKRVEKRKIAVAEADPSKCVAEGLGLTSAEINSIATFTVSVMDDLNKPCTHPECELTTTLQSLVDDSIVETTQKNTHSSTYEVQYTATQRGRHQLSVAVNGLGIHGSPFAVFVEIPPTKLGKPVQVIEDLKRPYSIAFNTDSELIVSEYGSQMISLYDRKSRKKKKREFGSWGEGEGEFKHPRGVAVDKSDGCIFVADSDNNRIQKFTRDGKFKKLVGGPRSGSGPKQFNDPRGLRVNNNKLYVCDTNNHRIQVFDTELNYITSIGGGKGSGPGVFNEPFDVSFDDSSMLHVTDHYNNRIQVLDQDGKYIREYGQLGQLEMPAFIHVDHDYVYVIERDPHCMCVFTTSGEFVHSIGKHGTGLGDLLWPCGVVVDTDGFVYVCDKGNHRVQIF